MVIVGIAGCTSSQSNTSSSGAQTSQSVALANAFGAIYVNETHDANVTYNVVANGTDAARITITEVNAANNTTTTIAFNVKQFDNTNDASDFYNSLTFGYNQNNSLPTTTTGGAAGAYEQVIGHAPTIKHFSTQVESLSLTSAQINVAAQEDGFVIYGTLTIMPTI